MSDRAGGPPRERVEGREKVTGRARYVGDERAEGLAHAVVLHSTVPRGRILEVDVAAALAAPGVLLALTHHDVPVLGRPTVALEDTAQRGSGGTQWLPLQDAVVHHFGQIVGAVVAETLEQATEAAGLVRVRYETDAPVLDLDDPRAAPFAPDKVWGEETDTHLGDVDRGFAEGAAAVDAEYVSQLQHHNSMELHATLAEWEGERLTVHEPTTWVYGARDVFAKWFGIPEEDVRVVQRHVGGSFGHKGPVWPHAAVAAMAARKLGRPVRLVLTRRQEFYGVGYRPEVRHRVRLAAAADGRLTAVSRDALAATAPFDRRVVAPVTATTRKLYACENLRTTYRLAHLNVPGPFTMRGPGESPGLFALESAVDELAYSLGMDPLALRLRHHADADPETGRPWSSKRLRECYERGAARFGWSSRALRAGTVRDGDEWVGVGMATVAYPATAAKASARATARRDGTVAVECATTDQGTGSRTVFTQVAAESLGIDAARVRFELGDTRQPFAPISAGSKTTASVGPAVRGAALALREQLAALAARHGGRPEDPDLLARAGVDHLTATFDAEPPERATEAVTRYSFGAQFCEVRVHALTGEVRVTRWVGAFDAGCIVHPTLARDQLRGGVVWGIGQALSEASRLDAQSGKFANDHLDEYHVPVNADVPDLDVFFVDGDDPTEFNPLGSKAVGEIGTVGAAAAVANAVYHATGRRVRQLPITPDALL